MPIEKWSDSVAIVHLGDDPQFSDDLDAASHLDRPCVSRILDFSAVHFVNSSNIATLLRLRRRIHDENGRLILCNVQSQVWATFLVTGLDKIFDISENVTTALATIQLNS
jgi:anti-anti-sigma factor